MIKKFEESDLRTIDSIQAAWASEFAPPQCNSIFLEYVHSTTISHQKHIRMYLLFLNNPKQSFFLSFSLGATSQTGADVEDLKSGPDPGISSPRKLLVCRNAHTGSSTPLVSVGLACHFEGWKTLSSCREQACLDEKRERERRKKMGNCFNKTKEQTEAEKRDAEISKLAEMDADEEQQKIKLLLLGMCRCIYIFLCSWKRV